MTGILEGLLFLAGDEGLSKEEAKHIMEIEEDTLNKAIKELKEAYNTSNRGINLEVLGERLKLTTKKEYRKYYEKLVDDRANEPLSESSLEVLAIVAYNEPITRMMVEEIRGTDSTHLLRKLVLRGFIGELGRSDLPGRPILYGITKDFLDYLGLSSKADLPPLTPIITNEEETELYRSKYSE